MKVIEMFIQYAFTYENNEYFISKYGLKILLSPESYNLLALIAFSNNESSISLSVLPKLVSQEIFLDSVIDDVGRILNKQRRKKGKAHSSQNVELIKDGLTMNLNRYPVYINNFTSYGFSRDVAIVKAQTLCLMQTIRFYYRKYDDVSVVYAAFKKIPIKGEVKSESIESFYKYTTRLIKVGIFSGLFKDPKQ